ncbi:MAG: CYTH domain-containing protein [Candidatus Peribacteria bacterium]|nr:MAG: CYTH domain-containing protein [Candidatus Peribacteria bacterium]
MVREGKKFSVRTRFVNGVSILVVKFSVDDTTSENGTARREWEHEFSLSIEELDQMLLDADFEYQAKWSREREEYKSEGVNICLDKNAGYGYVAEFEKILGLEDDLDTAKEELRAMISDLGYEELDQERLERMFAYYNENWRDYYGTENTFEME